MLGDEYEELSSSSSRNLFLGGVTSCSVSLELGILRGEEENWRVRGISAMGRWNRSKQVNNRKLLSMQTTTVMWEEGEQHRLGKEWGEKERMRKRSELVETAGSRQAVRPA